MITYFKNYYKTDGGSVVNEIGFLNDLALINNDGMKMAEIPVQPNKTYVVCRRVATPTVWRDNYLAVVFRDQNGNAVGGSYEWALNRVHPIMIMDTPHIQIAFTMNIQTV